MGLFNNLFKESEKKESSKSAINWKQFTEMSQFDEIKKSDKPVIVFKHSTRCSISSMVLRSFESSYNFEEGKADLYFIDLLNYRQISDAVSEQFNIFHESPQLLIIKNGEAVANASHSEINNIDLSSFLEK